MTTKVKAGLGTRILLGMIIGGAGGAWFGEAVVVIQPVGEIFIRLLMAAAIPLVFFNLLAGLTALTDLRTFGRLAGKIVSYYMLTTVCALIVGVVVMSMIKPGMGVRLTEPVSATVGDVPTIGTVLVDLVPTNIVAAFAEGKVAQIVVFAILLGIATLFLPEKTRDSLRSGYAMVAELFRKLVDIILKTAPIGIGALFAVTVGRHGAQLFGPLAKFLVGIYAALITMVIVYMILLRLLSNTTPWQFFRQSGALWATTTATSSSLASLSVSLEVAERMGFPRSIYSLTLPLGAQINKDGTSVMLTGILLFTAQAAGVEFSFGEMISILLVGLLLSEGSGGIPGGGLVIAFIFVKAFNLPLEIAGIVAGIYRLIDMGITTVNVMGDMVGTAIVVHSEAGRTSGAST